MRILHVAEVGGIGGVQKWVLELALAQTELGNHVSIMLPPMAATERPQLGGIEILEWGLEHVRGKDIVHSHAVYGFANASLRRTRGGPTLIHTYLGTVVAIQLAMHWYQNFFGWGGFHVPRNIFCEFIGGQAAHKVIAISQKVSREIRHFYRIPPKKITVIPGAVTLRDVHSKILCREVLALNDDSFAFLFVGRADPFKDLDSTLMAFQEVKRIHPEVSLYVAPEQVVPAAVKSIDFDQEMMPILYGGCDAFISSSVWDGYSLAAHEALGYGLPTIVSDMTGISDYCAHGVNAMVVRRRPAKTYVSRLTSAMSQLVKHPPLRQHLAAYAKDSFAGDWIGVAKETSTVYESAQASRE